MPEPDEKVIPQTPSPTGADGGSGDSDSLRQEVETLRAFKAGYDSNIAPFIEKVTPFYDSVTRYVDDESYRQVADNAWKGFEAIRQEQGPQIPEYAKEQNAKIDKVVKVADDFVQQQRMAAMGQQVISLSQAYPILAENNFEMVGKLIKEAEEIGIPTVEQAIKYINNRAPALQAASIPAPKPAPKPQPKPALRGDASAPGLADTPQRVPKNAKEMRSFIRSRVGQGG